MSLFRYANSIYGGSDTLIGANYGLLPWFALTVPSVRLFCAFQLSEIGVWLTTLGAMGRITPDIIVPTTDEEELDLLIKRTPGRLELLDDKQREKIQATRDSHDNSSLSPHPRDGDEYSDAR